MEVLVHVAFAEAVVITQQQHFYAHFIAQRVLHKVAGRSACKLPCEGDDAHLVDAAFPQQRGLLLYRCEVAGRERTVEERPWMSVECHGDGMQVALLPYLLQPVDDVPVSQMHAVEVTYDACRRLGGVSLHHLHDALIGGGEPYPVVARRVVVGVYAFAACPFTVSCGVVDEEYLVEAALHRVGYGLIDSGVWLHHAEVARQEDVVEIVVDGQAFDGEEIP